MYWSQYNGAKFPAQKKSIKQKGEDWRKACVDGAENLALNSNPLLRQSYYNKRINYDLYSDILDQEDIEKICNPMGLGGMEAPAKMMNYPVCNPRIDVLVGESIQRKIPWVIKAVNEDVINEKQDQLKKKFLELFSSHLQNPNLSEEEMAEALKQFEHYRNYSFRDVREEMMTHICNDLVLSQNLEFKWSKIFKDALIASEGIGMWDIVSGEPVFEKLNPLNVFTFASGESNYIEDSDIIVIVGYMSPGQLIDYFYDDLTPKEIDRIESNIMDMVGEGDESDFNIDNRSYDVGLDQSFFLDSMINMGKNRHGSYIFSPFDNDGNLRVVRVFWKSRRKMKKVTVYDEFGNEDYEIYDENFDSKDLPTSIFWINEWWEGVKIGGSASINQSSTNAIYLRMRPKPVQVRSSLNPSKCHPGIVGTIYNTNDNVSISLMDRMKPYQYLFNIVHYNLEKALALNIGEVMNLDLATIPEDWEIDKWMAYVKLYGIAVRDSFAEGKKGATTGKVAGQVGNFSGSFSVSTGQSIQLYINILDYINRQIGYISGISDSRLASINNREAVRNVEREITQSSHITEYWFYEHDQFKLRCMEVGMEFAKYCYQSVKNKKRQYILGNGSIVMYNVDGDLLKETDYGIYVTDSRAANDLIRQIKELSQAMVQNDKITTGQLVEILSSTSLATITNKTKLWDDEKKKELQSQQEKDRQVLIQQSQDQLKAKEMEQNFKREEWDREDIRAEEERKKDILIEMMKINGNQTEPIRENNDSDLKKLQLAAEKIRKDYELKVKDLNEKERHNKETEKISRKAKAKPAAS